MRTGDLQTAIGVSPSAACFSAVCDGAGVLRQSRMTMARTLKLYKLADATSTPGIRPMRADDASQVQLPILTPSPMLGRKAGPGRGGHRSRFEPLRAQQPMGPDLAEDDPR